MSDFINRDAALAAVADAIADGRNVYRALADVPVVGVPVVGAPRRMTCREWVKRTTPDDCDVRFCGGVLGCPFDHWPGRVRRICKDEGNPSSDAVCGRCWDQLCPEGGADDAAD